MQATRKTPQTADVAIVGGSFAGLAAGLQLARASRKVLVFDTGLPRNRFAAGAHGVLGHEGKPPEDLRAQGRAELLAYPTVSWLDKAVSSVSRDEDGFQITTKGQSEFRAARVILSYGVRDQLPAIEGAQEAWGTGVLSCPYCHGYEVRGRRLGILFTGEGSLHQAKLLPDWSDDLVFFSNGNDLSGEVRESLQSRGIKIEPRPVTRLHLRNGHLQAVELEHRDSVLRDALFMISTVSPTTNLAETLGCAMVEGPFGRHIEVDNLQETTVPGVYAAGDIARPMHNLTWAMADGVTAGIFAHQSLLADFNPYQRPRG